MRKSGYDDKASGFLNQVMQVLQVAMSKSVKADKRVYSGFVMNVICYGFELLKRFYTEELLESFVLMCNAICTIYLDVWFVCLVNSRISFMKMRRSCLILCVRT